MGHGVEWQLRYLLVVCRASLLVDYARQRTRRTCLHPDARTCLVRLDSVPQSWRRSSSPTGCDGRSCATPCLSFRRRRRSRSSRDCAPSRIGRWTTARVLDVPPPSVPPRSVPAAARASGETPRCGSSLRPGGRRHQPRSTSSSHRRPSSSWSKRLPAGRRQNSAYWHDLLLMNSSLRQRSLLHHMTIELCEPRAVYDHRW